MRPLHRRFRFWRLDLASIVLPVTGGWTCGSPRSQDLGRGLLAMAHGLVGWAALPALLGDPVHRLASKWGDPKGSSRWSGSC